MEPENRTKQVMATLAVLVLVVVIVFGAKAFNNRSVANKAAPANTSTGTSTTTTPSTSGPTTATTSSYTYKDGMYSSDGNFNTPGGYQSIGVKVTIKNDVVTGAIVTDQTTDRESAQYSQMFIDGFSGYVVGKKVSSISLYGVSGASLTSEGFNNALSRIKNQAKA